MLLNFSLEILYVQYIVGRIRINFRSIRVKIIYDTTGEFRRSKGKECRIGLRVHILGNIIQVIGSNVIVMIDLAMTILIGRPKNVDRIGFRKFTKPDMLHQRILRTETSSG